MLRRLSQHRVESQKQDGINLGRWSVRIQVSRIGKTQGSSMIEGRSHSWFGCTLTEAW